MQRFRRNRSAAALCAFIALVGRAIAEDPAAQIDFVLRGGTLVDGSGSPPFVGDLVIAHGRILELGRLESQPQGRQIDCRGLIVAPGFIDLHNHSDDPILSARARANVNFLTQGCTTIVTGNCGFGHVDVARYFAQLEAGGAGTHVAHLLPHGSLRAAVMGSVDRAPSADELVAMKDLARQAMRDGASGMSTGLIYIPGSFAKTDELIEIARVVGQAGGFYASHMRDEGAALLDSVAEVLRIGGEAQLPVHVSHFKAIGSDAWGSLRVAAETIEQARAAGQRITADQYPYVASSTSLEATLLPAWSREGGRQQLEARLNDAEARGRIRAEVEAAVARSGRIQIAACQHQPGWIGKSLEEIAKSVERPVADLVLDIESHGGARIVNFGMQEEEVRYAMRLPWVATASDGNAMQPDSNQPHPRSFGTFARKLGYYALDQHVLSLEQAVRSATSLPAEVLSLTDRGLLKPGLVADVVVFDPTTFRDRATYEAPYQYSTGMRYVFVAGSPAIYDGVPTGALAGKPLRRPGTPPTTPAR